MCILPTLEAKILKQFMHSFLQDGGLSLIRYLSAMCVCLLICAQGHAHAVDAHLNTLGGEIEASQPVLLSDTLLDPFAQEPLQSHEPYVPLEHFAPVDEFPTVVQELLMPDPLAAPDVLPELPLLPVDSPFVVYDPLPETADVTVLPEAHEAREVRSLFGVCSLLIVF